MGNEGIFRRIMYRLEIAIFKQFFPFWQMCGFHITNNHYSSPIPDTRMLKEALWLQKSELIGIDMNDLGQIELLNKWVRRFKSEYDAFPRRKTAVPSIYYLDNVMFGPVDAESLYCMVRYFRPKLIYEVGSGYSTCLAAQAVRKNKEEGIDTRLIAIEPYPNKVLSRGFKGLSKVVVSKVEDIDIREWAELKENDILFIDSSHVVKCGSDVQVLLLEILPRLNQGVIVHFHDIFLPSEYPKEWILKDYRFYTEQYVLHAFMMFNVAFEVLWAASYMHLKHPDELEGAFSSYKRGRVWPGSFWMRKKL